MENIKMNKKSLRNKLRMQNNLQQKNIAILSGSTIGEIKNDLEIALLQRKINPKFWLGDYNLWYEDANFYNYSLIKFKPDIIYIHTTNKNIAEFPKLNNTLEQFCEILDKTYIKFEQAWKSIKENYNCPIIQNNFEYLPYRVMGNAEVYFPNGTLKFIDKINQMFYKYANENSNFYINDINYQASYYGLKKWSNMQQWYLYKYALDIEAIPLLCANIANIIKSIYGLNKKALAIDLDNTLWGGVIGDDGVEEIRLGPETPEGRCFVDFQRYLKAISDLGVTLNICSKNEEANALTGLAHGSSQLRKEDFVLIKANWNAKHLNVNEISEELNIGLDTIVLLDDNPAEREIVRSFLPEVEVPEILEPESYICNIDWQGYFEVTTLTQDDLKRNEFYSVNQKRYMDIGNFKSYEEYLIGLQMSSNMEPFNEKNMTRTAQLINKTNQFNFTTKRYTEVEVEAVASSEDYITVAATLTDKFGENGITSVLIAKVDGKCVTVDLWVMSCRVFKRNLEYAVFDYLVEQCKIRGLEKIVGLYIPTKKNALIENFYEELGFSLFRRNNGRTVWKYNIPNKYFNKNKVIGVNENEQK